MMPCFSSQVPRSDDADRNNKTAGKTTALKHALFTSSTLLAALLRAALAK